MATEVAIHRIAKIRTAPLQVHRRSDGTLDFTARRIVIETDDGSDVELVLFSNKPDVLPDLEVKAPGATHLRYRVDPEPTPASDAADLTAVLKDTAGV